MGARIAQERPELAENFRGYYSTLTQIYIVLLANQTPLPNDSIGFPLRAPRALRETRLGFLPINFPEEP